MSVLYNFTHMHVDKEIQTLKDFSIGSGTTHGHAAFTLQSCTCMSNLRPNPSKQALLPSAPNNRTYKHNHLLTYWKPLQDSSRLIQKTDDHSNNNTSNNRDNNNNQWEEKNPPTEEASNKDKDNKEKDHIQKKQI